MRLPKALPQNCKNFDAHMCEFATGPAVAGGGSIAAASSSSSSSSSNSSSSSSEAPKLAQMDKRFDIRFPLATPPVSEVTAAAVHLWGLLLLFLLLLLLLLSFKLDSNLITATGSLKYS